MDRRGAESSGEILEVSGAIFNGKGMGRSDARVGNNWRQRKDVDEERNGKHIVHNKSADPP